MASEWGAQAAAPCSGNDLPARGRPDYITEITCSLKNSKVREAIKLSAWQSQLVLHQLPRLGTSRVGTSQEDGHVWVNKPVAIPQRYCLLNSSICARDISRLAPPRLIKILVLFFFCCFFFIIYFFFPGCNDRWSAHKPCWLQGGHPQALSQVWSSWSWSRLPPMGLAQVSGMPHSLFTSVGIFHQAKNGKPSKPFSSAPWDALVVQVAAQPNIFIVLARWVFSKGRCWEGFTSCWCLRYVSAIAVFLWITCPLAQPPV